MAPAKPDSAPTCGSAPKYGSANQGAGRLSCLRQPFHVPSCCRCGAGPRACRRRRYPPQPPAVAQLLDSVRPANRTIVQDGGHFCGWVPMYCQASDPEGMMLVGTAFQTVGLGLPAAVGAAVARPERTTVLISGDGGALMALADLETAVRTIPSGVMVMVPFPRPSCRLHARKHGGHSRRCLAVDLHQSCPFPLSIASAKLAVSAPKVGENHAQKIFGICFGNCGNSKNCSRSTLATKRRGPPSGLAFRLGYLLRPGRNWICPARGRRSSAGIGEHSCRAPAGTSKRLRNGAEPDEFRQARRGACAH